jgi:hypothetical protein
MMWAVTELLISEHEAEFALRLPKNYQTLSVLIKAERYGDGRQTKYSPYLYVLAPAGEKDTEEVAFLHVESGETFEGACAYVGSYQEMGYYKVKHLFRRI